MPSARRPASPSWERRLILFVSIALKVFSGYLVFNELVLRDALRFEALGAVAVLLAGAQQLETFAASFRSR